MSQSSGQFSGLDGLVVYRGDLEELSGEEAELSDQLDTAILDGAASTRAKVVGVEQVSTDPSSVGFFGDNALSSVDNIDQPSGKVSLVYVLAGAEGSFGVKAGSEQLLPDLLRPAPGPGGGSGAGAAGAGQG
jgi:hypothetical protein